MQGSLKVSAPGSKAGYFDFWAAYFSWNDTGVSCDEYFEDNTSFVECNLNLNSPCPRTVKDLAWDGVWGQGVVYVLNYASAVG